MILETQYHLELVTDDTRKMLPRYLHLSAKLLKAVPRASYDLVFLGFFGHPLMPYLRAITRKPILFDAFVSVYDTVCFDRKLFKPNSIPGRLAFWLDWYSCMKADHILLDTQSHIDYFVDQFHIPRDKFSRIFVGCDENIFYPRGATEADPKTVLYYGSYLPLQGIDTIIRAAKIIEGSRQLQFRIIGQGMEFNHIQQLAREYGLRNIEFSHPVPLVQLPHEIAKASLCLGGHFGASEKARRVIAGKTFQCLAMGKPTIVGENPANHELLTHGVDAWFCKMNDPEALAAAIQYLVDSPDLCARLGENAHATFLEKASIAALRPQVLDAVERLMARTRSA